MTTSKARRKAKGRYSDAQRIDFLERMKAYNSIGVPATVRWNPKKQQWAVSEISRIGLWEDTEFFDALRDTIDAAMRLESKARLVRVRRGGK